VTNAQRQALLRLGHEIARREQVPIQVAFADSWTGDVARFEVRRRLRRDYPGQSAAQRDRLIQELFEL